MSFGDRLLPDEEGVELASRSAARQEALAVVRELSRPGSTRWASWFLRVADHRGQFLSLAIGQPALEIVSNDRQLSGAPKWQETREAARVRRRADALAERADTLFAETLVLRRRTAALLERHHQLRAELSAELRANESAGDRARQLIEYARLETSEPHIYRVAARRCSPPQLVLIPGRN